MGKLYDTGKGKWEFGTPYDTQWNNGKATVKRRLGPCPYCGSVTFDYGGGAKCSSWACNFWLLEFPKWWNEDIKVFMDGNQWAATRDDFENLQESPAGFGDTPRAAIADLKKDEIKHKAEAENGS